MTDEHHDDNKLIAQRREKLDAIRLQGNAFPNDFRRSALAEELDAEFDSMDKEQLEILAHTTRVAGRVIRMRGPFLVILDSSGPIQLYRRSIYERSLLFVVLV